MTTRRCRVLAVSALKGGVGKTTTAVNLAAAAARAGRRTLLVDADPQGGVGMSLGLAPETRGLAAWVTKDASFDDSVVRAYRENLDDLPAGERLLDGTPRHAARTLHEDPLAYPHQRRARRGAIRREDDLRVRRVVARCGRLRAAGGRPEAGLAAGYRRQERDGVAWRDGVGRPVPCLVDRELRARADAREARGQRGMGRGNRPRLARRHRRAPASGSRRLGQLQVFRQQRVVDRTARRPVELEDRLPDGWRLGERDVDADRREDLREAFAQRVEEFRRDGGPQVVERRQDARDPERLFARSVLLLHEEARLLERREREKVELRGQDELVREVVHVLEEKRRRGRTVEDDDLIGLLAERLEAPFEASPAFFLPLLPEHVEILARGAHHRIVEGGVLRHPGRETSRFGSEPEGHSDASLWIGIHEERPAPGAGSRGRQVHGGRCFPHAAL